MPPRPGKPPPCRKKNGGGKGLEIKNAMWDEREGVYAHLSILFAAAKECPGSNSTTLNTRPAHFCDVEMQSSRKSVNKECFGL